MKHNIFRRALPLLLVLALCLGMMPTAFAAQDPAYHDPAEHWQTANNRTNELDVNSILTHETFKCAVCEKTTCRYLGEYESIDELNHLAHLIDDLSPADVEILEAILKKGDHNDSAKELINLVQNLDCYIFYPDIRDADDLGVYYVRSGALEVPEHLENYFDYEAYGRDIAMEEDGEFVDGGYILYGGSFTEVYSGREDIPDEHRIFAYPKLNIREQLTAFKEIADRAADVPAKPAPALAHSDR